MAWQRKARGDEAGYFYRSVRIKGRATQVYFGRGPAAQAAAAAVERLKADRARDRAGMQAERLRWSAADDLLGQLRAVVDLLAKATLLVSGCHQHHGGEWRRRRHGSGQV